jgi:hypothetical protein
VRLRLLALLLAAGVCSACGRNASPPVTASRSVPKPAAPSSPQPSRGVGSPGAGDRRFPLLGSGGYDLAHVRLEPRFAGGLESYQGRAVPEATAT